MDTGNERGRDHVVDKTRDEDQSNLIPGSESPDINLDVTLNVLPELCEFAPLDFLLQQLPRKAQRASRALPAITVEFTCLDVNKDFIVLGANFSIVFVYDRHENTFVKLRCEDRGCRITCVKLLTSIDHQIAVGTSSGQVEVYLLPAKRPGQIFKELKKFLIDGGHRSSVTCAEWSTNGMKLFTADAAGCVVYSDVDFYENECHSEHIHKEDMPVVQLNYAHKILIISTFSRTVLCHTDENYRLQQVGQQPRKNKGYFGGHFVPGLCKASDATLYATRPGLRMWHATVDGTVQKTLKFKHLLASQHQTIMLQSSTRSVVRNTTDLQFGPVLFFNESYVLTWSHNLLVVLDIHGPNGARVVASSQGDLGSIISVATSGDEIYVLRREPYRPLVRIATTPDFTPPKELPTLSEAEHLLKVPGPAMNSSKIAGSDSPSAQRKTSFKQGLSAMRSLFSKAKEEIADTTAKLMVPKFGKHESDEGQSAGSSWQSSQDNTPVSSGETPDASLSPELLAAQFAAKTNISREHSSHEMAQVQTEPCETAQATDQSPEQIRDEPPAVTLSEKKLLQIGQESYDEVLFQPVRQTKKKKKKSHKASKKELADRSATPSPIPDELNTPPNESSRSGLETDRNRSDSTKSDDQRLKPNSFMADNHSNRSDSFSSDSRKGHSDSVNSTGSDGHMNDILSNSSGASKSPSLNTESNLIHQENPQVSESIQSESVRQIDDVDIGQVALESPEIGHADCHQYPPGRVILGGVISSSVDNAATCLGTPTDSSMPNPSPRDFPGTLRSWEGTPKIPERAIQKGGRWTECTDSIHSLRSDADNLKLDFDSTVSSEVLDQHTRLLNKEPSPSSGSAVPLRLDLRKSDSTDEEFYGKYLPETPSSEANSPPAVFVAEESLYGAHQEPVPACVDAGAHDNDEGTAEETPIPENIQQRFAGSWMQCSTPGYIMQLVVSDKHVWCVDNRDKVYHSLVSNVTIKWNKLKDSAMQIASSPNGNIVWRLHRKSGTAFACAPISPLSPIGTKWYEASKGAIHICLDENMAWVVKTNGDIYVHKGISRDLPLTREERVNSNAYVVQIAANRGVVWAIGSNKKVMYRSDISRTVPEGKNWMDLDGDDLKLRFVSVALDSRNIGWGIDDDGLVWFRTGVTPGFPRGDDKKWWQVPMGEYLMQDPNALKMLLNIAGNNATVDRMTTWLKRQYYRATHIAASASSVWVCGSYHYKSSLHVSKGNLLGSLWENGCPVGLPLSAVWVSVSSTGVYGPSGMIWAALKSGEVFCFPPDTRKPLQVDPPRAGVIFKHLSATSDTMWALQEDGDIYVRKQISQRCPQGLSWKMLVLDQLGPCKIVHFSCGAEVVWACDNEGMIYLRIGVDIPHDEALPPAWVPVDGRATGYGAYFVQVFCSIDNRLVWALDNKRTVYVRRGICGELPVGLEWEVVEGTQAIHLCISCSTVWALCPNGDIACRFGITEKNCMGDYWKKVPGSYTYLSVTQSDDLWAISNEGKLYQRFTKMFQRRGIPQVEQLSSPIGEDDWELL
ncbi:tectonin beta-propeller repeat-containing protein 2-like [Acanthaster planci]|uniref:Tectonin beta-propeller repeat-containing protein 2-like n=1 Tax=Acanthaster planci TaxID=133434 RepID=A0A8B7YVY4_ACAPL|nr:tectonin beta-propeller repeat-containing protein 2-like [Acanthaster planci]XP_022096650.1 tectonin beta-propeller repeat-containing protein 2-like [Acanthaster planci]XP_022096651.1 tectonin beta-propeller repeat-containing protein 2-like [Acanthaster planci]